MKEFGLTPEHARELAGKAIARLRKQKRGRLNTNPIDQELAIERHKKEKGEQ